MTDARALGVYVHWPYCARICPYCDFNVYKNRDVDAAAWTQALTRDLAHWAARTKGRRLTSLYFGGGTPSLAPAGVVEAVIDACERLWGFHPDPEITLEANPTDAEQSQFAAFAGAGINRLSLGVQSLRDDALAFLGRNHSADDARRALGVAQSAFRRVTFDLIYARPGQTAEDWRAELGEALSLGATHLSLYQLTIEPKTAFAKAVDAGRWAPASEDRCTDHFDLAQDMTAAAGLPAYEVSNHAAPGERSRHNLLYWTYQDYIGVGPGAHGRTSAGAARIATETTRKPEAYLDALAKGRPAAEETTLTTEDQTVERFSFGLRLTDGMALDADDPFFERDGAAERLHALVADGLVAWNGKKLTATADGRRVLNAVLYALFG